MSKLYHHEIHWLSSFTEQSYKLVENDLRLSKHLDEHLSNPDIKHDIELVKLFLVVQELKRNRIEPFEFEVDNDVVTKCVIRTKYDDNRDIGIVFRKGLIVTCWLNDKLDFHKNLDKTKYERK